MFSICAPEGATIFPENMARRTTLKSARAVAFGSAITRPWVVAPGS
jgi:putative N-acetylmannosamine-6-phosphate epimerase